MASFSPQFLLKLSYSGAALATMRRLGESRGQQELFTRQIPEELKILRQAALVESSESSNRIEGITARPQRIEALVLKSSAPQDRSEQEIAGYRDALQLVHESHEHMPFTPNVILQLHSMLYRYLPDPGGRWKPADNEIVERGPDGEILRVRFKATPAVATPAAIEDLCSGYRTALESGLVEPLVAAPLAVLDFLCVHPFSDGNGRIARLLTLLLLYQRGYRVGQYISLERIVEESRETYYESLERSSAGWHESAHDAQPWLEYFWGVLLRAYAEFESRAGELADSRTKSERVRQAVIRQSGPFAISDIEAACPGVSRDLVRLVLRQMRDEKTIQREGLGRGAKWRAVEQA